jgi:Transposase DNA-binding
MRTQLQSKRSQQPDQPVSFGEMNFGNAQLGDHRRSKRLVRVANALVRHPGGTLPEKFGSPAELDALYRLMKADAVTHESLLAPHRARTLERITLRSGPVLILHDTTELDFSTHRSLKKLGQIGNGSRRGYLCHNSLAVDPATREVIGLMGQILHCRAKVRKNETQAQRRCRNDRESRLWLEGTQTLPASWNLIDICDRGADTFEFFESEFHSGRRFVVRSSYSRSIHTAHGSDAPHGLLHTFARTLAPMAEHHVKVQRRRIEKKPKKKGRKKVVIRPQREAALCIAAAPVLVRAPLSKNGEHGNEPLALWIVRVWEPKPPAGEDPLEWFLLTNHPVQTPAEALDVGRWYECRWIIEEYHKAMKTGCGVENPQFQSEQRLQPMIALLSVVSLTLLNLRELARRPEAKTRPATDVVSEDYVKVLCGWRHKKLKPDWTIYDFCYALARLGGHQNRRSDGHPGWLTLWRGWTHLQAMLDGADAMNQLNKCA